MHKRTLSTCLDCVPSARGTHSRTAVLDCDTISNSVCYAILWNFLHHLKVFVEDSLLVHLFILVGRRNIDRYCKDAGSRLMERAQNCLPGNVWSMSSSGLSRAEGSIVIVI